MEDAKNYAEINKALTQAFTNGGVSIKFVYNGNQEIQQKSDRDKESEDEIVQEALDVFDGELVK